MKETGYMKVLSDFSFPENRLVVNPNDGLDLDLLMTETVLEFVYGESPATYTEDGGYRLHGTLVQKNECQLGLVELSQKALKRMGNPRQVRLHLIPAEPYPVLLISAD